MPPTSGTSQNTTAAAAPRCLEDRYAGAARRVDGGVGYRDADQVDQRQRQADSQRQKPAGARLSVTP